MALLSTKSAAPTKVGAIGDLIAKKNYAKAIEVIKDQLKAGKHNPQLHIQLAAEELPLELPPPEEHQTLQPEMLFEPTIQEVLEQQLLPKYVENVVYQALLEASAAQRNCRGCGGFRPDAGRHRKTRGASGATALRGASA